MHADPILPRLVASILVILAVGLFLRRYKQPHVLGYLLAGLVMGPFGLAIFSDTDAISRLGDLGLVLLLFFIGMEMSLPRLASNWRIAVVGTGLQILISVLVVAGIGAWGDWPFPRVLLLGFVISLSCTAVAVSMLKTWGHLDSQLGEDVMGILVVQDLALAPMLLILGFSSGSGPSSMSDIVVPILGAAGVVGFGTWMLRRETIHLPWGARIREDPELQLFAAAFICLGFALVTSLLGLSTALGAFLAGIVVASSDDTEWVSRNLEPFRVVLVAMFFVSIGLLLDLRFTIANFGLIATVIAGVLLTNTFVNAGIVRVFGRPWRHSLFAGALLAQVGDFSFVLAAIGLDGGLITIYGYQLTVSVIFGTLLLSPFWVQPFRRLAGQGGN